MIKRINYFITTFIYILEKILISFLVSLRLDKPFSNLYIPSIYLPILRANSQCLFLFEVDILLLSYSAYRAPAKQPPAPIALQEKQPFSSAEDMLDLPRLLWVSCVKLQSYIITIMVCVQTRGQSKVDRGE